MKKIMLVCSAGMSTSMLVSRMLKVADEKNIEVSIFAKAEAQAEEVLETEKIDLVLLGPQVKFLEEKYKENCSQLGVKFSIINIIDYGSMNGAKVLDDALNLISEG